MVEPVSIVTVIAACGSLLAILFDKIRSSRCRHIILCCGACECDRDVENTNDVHEDKH